MGKILGLAALPLLALTLASPAQSAPEDVQFLKEFVGSWSGSSRLSGDNTDPVKCQMSFTPGNRDKLNYAGRCNAAGFTISLKGTIVYNDAGRRYEAAMTSNVSFSANSVGNRKGDSIHFAMKEADRNIEGQMLDIDAALVMSPQRIDVSFNVLRKDTGERIEAAIPFKR